MDVTTATWIFILMSIGSVSLLIGVHQNRRIHLIVSIVLIIFSAAMVYLLFMHIAVYDILVANKEISNQVAIKEKLSAGVWMVVFPAIYGAIGVNLLCEHLKLKD
jgi:hypothetical protein